jgi:hypothetical protein
VNDDRTVKYLRTLEDMQAAAVNEIIADGFGVPATRDPFEGNGLSTPKGPRETGGKRSKLFHAARKWKVGSHAQKALTPEQRKSRAKTNRRNKRKANGGANGSDAREVEAFKKFLREKAAGRLSPEAREYSLSGSDGAARKFLAAAAVLATAGEGGGR